LNCPTYQSYKWDPILFNSKIIHITLSSFFFTCERIEILEGCLVLIDVYGLCLVHQTNALKFPFLFIHCTLLQIVGPLQHIEIGIYTYIWGLLYPRNCNYLTILIVWVLYFHLSSKIMLTIVLKIFVKKTQNINFAFFLPKINK